MKNPQTTNPSLIYNKQRPLNLDTLKNKCCWLYRIRIVITPNAILNLNLNSVSLVDMKLGKLEKKYLFRYFQILFCILGMRGAIGKRCSSPGPCEFESRLVQVIGAPE